MKAEGSGWNNGQIDGTVGGSKTIYIAYVKDGNVFTSSDEGFFESQNSTAVTLSKGEGEYLYKLTFNSPGGADIRVKDDSSYGSFFVDVQENQGEQGNQGQDNSNIRLLDGNHNRISDCNVVYDELGDAHRFYVVVDAGSSDLKLKAEIIDHYRTMHNDNENGKRKDVAVTEDAIKFELVEKGSDDFDNAAQEAGFDAKNTGIYVFSATVDSVQLRAFSYRKCGIVCGSLYVQETDVNGEIKENGYGEDIEIAVCSNGFVNEDNVSGGLSDNDNNLMFVDEPQGNEIDEKTIELYKKSDDRANLIYLAALGDYDSNDFEQPDLAAYARYAAANNEFVYEKVDLVDLSSRNAVYDGRYTTYTINLKEFYGHNTLMLVVQAGETKKLITVNKAIKYEFDNAAFAVADDISDYMNEMWGSDFKRLETETVANDNNTTTLVKTDNNVNGKRSANMPYDGGFYGTVIKLADGYRLKGIETSGYDESGNGVTTKLDYLINQSIYYKVKYTGDGEPDFEVFDENYNCFQIPKRDNENAEYLVQIDIGLAEFRYNGSRYEMEPYNAVRDAITGYMNFVYWMKNAFNGACEIEFMNSCLYYDIFCGGDAGRDDQAVQTLYKTLDKIGTVKFLTEKDSVDSFAGNVGVKAADDVSAGCWGENGFDSFSSTEGTSAVVKTHESTIDNFNGNNDEKVLSAYDFGMGEAGFVGMLDVYMPVPENVEKPQDCKVYWMAQGEDDDRYPIPMPARYVESSDGKGYMAFTTSHFSDYVLVADEANVKEESGNTGGNSGGAIGGGGGAAAVTPEVTTDTNSSTTTSQTDVKLTESTAADGTNESTANVTVSAANQKEILKQAKSSKSKEIILQVSKDSVKNASKVDVQLDKSFIESIVKDTDAKLTVKTPFGDKTYTQDELKALAAAATGKTVSLEIVKSEKTDDELKAEQHEAAKATVAKASMKARSSKTSKGNVKIVFIPDEETEGFIKEMKALGYTVKYKFYRSSKKTSGYKAMLTKSSRSYTNTSGVKGKMYYYKARVQIFDKDGKLIAQTALKQCKYANRIFG